MSTNRFLGTSVVLLAAFSLAHSVRGQDQGNPIEQAFSLAKKTGRPILAMGTRAACGNCVALKQRLSSDAGLRPMLAQYIPLNLDADSPVFQAWAAKYQQPGGVLPFVYVVRADGELIGSQSDPHGPAVPQLLQTGLAKAGRMLDEKQSAILNKSIEKAQKSIGDGKVAEAAEEMARFLSVSLYGDAVTAAQKLTQKIIDEGKTRLADAGTKLESPSDAVEGAISIVMLERAFKRYPDLTKEIKEVVTKHKEHKSLFIQAAAYDKAVALEEKEQIPQAIGGFKAVTTRFAGTPIATLAEEQVKRLEEGGDKTTSKPAKADPSVDEEKPTARPIAKTVDSKKPSEGATDEKPAARPTPKTPTNKPADQPTTDKPATDKTATDKPDGEKQGDTPATADPKRAAAYLKLARSLAPRNAARAREYCQKAIDNAPGSDVADEAGALLKQLEKK